MSAHGSPPAGGGRGSEQGEGESQCFLWLQTSESVHVSFESAREQGRCLEGWGGGCKCTLVDLFLRGEVSECVRFEHKGKLINSIRNESQQVVHVCGLWFWFWRHTVITADKSITQLHGSLFPFHIFPCSWPEKTFLCLRDYFLNKRELKSC